MSEEKHEDPADSVKSGRASSEATNAVSRHPEEDYPSSLKNSDHEPKEGFTTAPNSNDDDGKSGRSSKEVPLRKGEEGEEADAQPPQNEHSFTNLSGGPVSPKEEQEEEGETTLVGDDPPTLQEENKVQDEAEHPRLEKLAQKDPSPWDHLSITIGPPVIILFDIVIPIIVYYTWYNQHTSRWASDCEPYSNRNQACPIPKPEFDDHILGYAIICFGFGELYILLARVWRLLAHRDQCAPLLSRNKWELDATSWVYAVAMLMALIPFVVGSTLEIPVLYLYSPAFLMGFLGIIMVITLIPVKTPIGINSHARGTPLRPFIYYAAEDFIAVDGLQDREFRVRYNARYDSSKAFRRMFLYLTFWWIFGVMVYIGGVSAVIFTVEFHVAFGLSLGVLFSYIVLWAIVSYMYVMIEMDRQRAAFEDSDVEKRCT